jgi:hypothetical protein
MPIGISIPFFETHPQLPNSRKIKLPGVMCNPVALKNSMLVFTW